MTFADARDYFGRMLAAALPNIDIFFMYQKETVTGDFAVYNLGGTQQPQPQGQSSQEQQGGQGGAQG